VSDTTGAEKRSIAGYKRIAVTKKNKKLK